ncbi:hypothetical protein PCC21_022870 [Pectobacterium carotovorum subsp. carotovorum PCC21]|nr:hypothetical protein PCC21_022870 [Pectobacterium carotovorum subsp. carotovorum PCC21]
MPLSVSGKLVALGLTGLSQRLDLLLMTPLLFRNADQLLFFLPLLALAAA